MNTPLPRTMDIYTLVGSKVEYTMPENGYELGYREGLEVGKTYTVASIDVGGWTSRVVFEELPGKWFNTVMFSNVED